jgi:SpoVK/Ycf46/Vps4 family AAA+-type ATPase
MIHTRICKPKARQDLSKTPESSYVKNKVIKWLGRLSENNVPLDGKFFDCLGWSMGTLRPLARFISDAIAGGSVVCDDKTAEMFRDFLEKKHRHAFQDFSGLSEQFPDLEKCARLAVKNAVKNSAGKAKPGTMIFSQGRKRIRRFWGLSGSALDLYELIYFKELFSAIGAYFFDRLEIFKASQRKLVAVMFGMTIRDAERSFSELESCGLIDLTPSYLTIFDDFLRLWDGTGNMPDFLYRLHRGKTLPLGSFTIQEGDMSRVISLLGSERQEPLHILFYGAPGTGKSTFAASLAKTLGLKMWSVAPGNSEKNSHGRRAALTACLNMASRQKGAFVLMDEADRFLDTNDAFGRERADKAWINDIMERPGTRVIWIANSVRHLDDSVKRRFTYSINFEPLGISERGNIWNRVLENNRAAKRLPAETVGKFARCYDIPPSIIESAVRQAKAAGGGSGFAETAERMIRSYITLRENGRKPDASELDMEKFSLESACVEGGIGEFLDICRAADSKKRGSREFPPGGATMLFYGPPGTGKSALARFLAHKLERKLIVKKASDLLGPYVGQTEQLIAEAFRRTAREEGVLLIDEADSFLFSRDAAARSWENTMINEFLTSLEECREFCVCTTNRMGELDPAALRRFSFKVSFTYAKPSQVETLYNALLSDLADGAMHSGERDNLLKLSSLAPGDFRVVRNQNWLAPKGSVTHARLIAALEAEQNAKLERTARRVGF